MAECLTVIMVAILSVSVKFLAATSLKMMSDKELQDLRQFDRTFGRCWYGRPMGEPDTDLKRPATAAYCSCLYQIGEGDANIPPLITNFAAKGHENVDIQNPVLAKEMVILESSLSWKKTDKLLTFESLNNVELTSDEIRYVATVGGIKENSVVQFKAVGSALKIKAKIKSHTMGADTIDDRDASNMCDFIVDRVCPTFPWLKPSNIDHARQKIIVTALGGEEAIKAALVKSACQHFRAALNPTLEDLKRTSGKKLTGLPDMP